MLKYYDAENFCPVAIGNSFRIIFYNKRINCYYRPQTKFPKVTCFTRVCQSTGGCLPPGDSLLQLGVCSGGICSRGCLLQGVPARGVLLLRGYLLGGGALVLGGSPGKHHPTMTATAAGGTHPTGMHSCLKYGCFKVASIIKFGIGQKKQLIKLEKSQKLLGPKI